MSSPEENCSIKNLKFLDKRSNIDKGVPNWLRKRPFFKIQNYSYRMLPKYCGRKSGIYMATFFRHMVGRVGRNLIR